MAVTLSASTAQAQEVILSVADNTGNELGGLPFTDLDAVSYNTATGVSAPFFSIAAGDLDAFHLLPSGNVLVSSLFNGNFNGTIFDDGDIVEIDPDLLTVTTVFSSDDVFSSTFEDISAVTVAPNGDLLISTLTDATFETTTTFTDGDIMRYNPTTEDVTLEVAEASIFDDGDGDIYGLHLLEDGRYAISSVSDEVVSGVAFEDGDIFIWDPITDTAELFFDEDDFTGTNTYDVDAVYIVSIPEPATLGLLSVAGLGMLRRRRGGEA
ncbi:MAG: PEP-CTERM sorting domain-containing protein [Planctomycetota bacterium]